MADQLNLVGAVIFWLYIAAALTFTTIALSTIIGLQGQRRETPNRGNFQQRIFSILALISFAVLSYNMLHVLIKSFELWSLDNSSNPPTDLQSLVRNIYHWSTNSSLFYDFATAIVATNARCLWVQSALFMTLFQCCELVLYGTTHHVPNLWAFLALSQILPISFAQNLLYLALLRTPSFSKGEASEIQGAALKKSDADSLIGLYWVALVAAPLVSQSGRQFLGMPLLMWVVLGTRALLLLPRLFVKTRIGDDGKEYVDRVWIGGAIMWPAIYAFIIRGSCMLADQEPLGSVIPALFEHPAVAALGMDSLLSLVSLGVWTLLQPDDRMSEKVE